MSTELIDILDTAIKIGLGASIAGISTYVLNGRKHQFEKEKEKIKDRNELIQAIAQSFEKSDSGANNAALMIRKYFYYPDDNNGVKPEIDIKALSAYLVDSMSYISSAQANANLLGLSELYSELSRYTVLINQVIADVEHIKDSDFDCNHFISEWDKLGELETCIHPLITKAYND